MEQVRKVSSCVSFFCRHFQVYCPLEKAGGFLVFTLKRKKQHIRLSHILKNGFSREVQIYHKITCSQAASLCRSPFLFQRWPCFLCFLFHCVLLLFCSQSLLSYFTVPPFLKVRVKQLFTRTKIEQRGRRDAFCGTML